MLTVAGTAVPAAGTPGVRSGLLLHVTGRYRDPAERQMVAAQAACCSRTEVDVGVHLTVRRLGASTTVHTKTT